jgi:glycerol-3-phosphate O-acyltransferase
MKSESLISILTGWLRNKFRGVRNYFACYVPPYTGPISQFILKLVFSGIRIPDAAAALKRQAGEQPIIIFVTKYKSYFEFLFYHTRYRNDGLPYPSIGFDYKFFFWQPARRLVKIIFSHVHYFLKHLAVPNAYQSGYIHEKLLAGESALLSLVEKKGFYRRFIKEKPDPLHYLIDIQNTIDRPIVFVPQIILYSRTPQTTRLSVTDMLLGTIENPGRIRRLFNLFKNPKKTFIEVCDPIVLSEFISRPDIRDLSPRNQAVMLRRHMLALVNRHRQSITGPVLKSRLEIREELLTNPALQKTIAEYASQQNVSIHEAQEQAAGFLDEIASNYNLKTIRFLDVVLRWMFKHIFDGMVIDQDGLERLKRASRKGPLILAPCHKSHLDYLILPYVFFNNNMPCPLIAAGKNLSFWPLGPIFRGGGAFFLRRSFKGEILYPKIFNAYLQKILNEGFHVKFFIEGGRSRTGKVLMPKIGFLSLLVEAYQNNRWDDMYFAPIYVGYDRVLEEKAYIHELEGGKKTPENLLNIIRARKFLKRKYGKIYVNFHEPISLRDYLSRFSQPFSEMPRPEQKEACFDFGERLLAAINRVTVVTPHAVIAAVILNGAPKRFYYKQVLAHAETYLAYLVSQDVNLADTLVMDQISAFNLVLDSFVQNNVIDKSISEFSDSTRANPLFKINESKRPTLEYYKNSGVTFFVSAAYTAMAILKTDAFQFSSGDLHAGYKFLKELFKNEFVYDPEQPVDFVVRKNLKAFINDAIIMPHPTLPDTYNVTSTGFRKLNLFAAFLAPYFESYWVVLNFFMKYTRKPIGETGNYLRKIQALGNRMYKRKEIERIEALTRINYQNAVTFFSTHGIVDPESSKEQIDFYVETFQQYRRYLLE